MAQSCPIGCVDQIPEGLAGCFRVVEQEPCGSVVLLVAG